MRKLISYLKLGQTKKGRRVYMQSGALADNGFDVGQHYSVDIAPDEFKITLRVDNSGNRKVSRKAVSNPTDKTQEKLFLPIIDLESKALAELIPDSVERVRCSVSEGIIEICAHHDDLRAQARLQRLKDKLEKGEPLSFGSSCTGGGFIDDALSQGMAKAGIPTKTAFVIEKEVAPICVAMRNLRSHCEDVLEIQGEMQDVDLSLLPKVDVFSGSLPCVGASTGGKAKNGLASAEEHASAGHLFFTWLNIVKQVDCSVAILENVVPWKDSVSQQVIRAVLNDMGYDVKEAVLDRDLGAFEKRPRFVCVAVTKGMDFDFADILPEREPESTFGEIMEDIPADSPRWQAKQYLFDKAKRDAATPGKSFGMQFFTAESTKMSVLRHGYHKGGSSDPLIPHPEGKPLYRLLTPVEHARCKNIDPKDIEGLSDTLAHQIMGNAVLHPVFRAVGRLVGASIRKVAGGLPTKEVLGNVESNTPAQNEDLSSTPDFGQLSLAM